MDFNIVLNKKKKKKKGMSIVTVLVAAGHDAGGLAQSSWLEMTKQQMQTQKKSETGVEVVAMSQRIVRTLYDGDACLNTIGAGTAISAGDSITVNAIKNKDGEDVYKSLDNDPNAPAYGNRLLKVKSLKVKVPPSPIPDNGGSGGGGTGGGHATGEFRLYRTKDRHQKVPHNAGVGRLQTTDRLRVGCECDSGSGKKGGEERGLSGVGGNWGGSPEQCTYERICPQGNTWKVSEKREKSARPCQKSPTKPARQGRRSTNWKTGCSNVWRLRLPLGRQAPRRIA